jgi:hypothetical protein
MGACYLPGLHHLVTSRCFITLPVSDDAELASSTASGPSLSFIGRNAQNRGDAGGAHVTASEKQCIWLSAHGKHEAASDGEGEARECDIDSASSQRGQPATKSVSLLLMLVEFPEAGI